MPGSGEVLFIDPAIDGIATILQNLRPGVEAIVLQREGSSARQMADALEGRRGLEAVHVMAHGAPGRVRFAAGEWSQATLARDRAALAAIGRALKVGGELRLWSCEARKGAEGEAFVAALSRAAHAAIAAACGRVGAAALGGIWELDGRGAEVEPPLTAHGAAEYAGVFATMEVVVTGQIPEGDTTTSMTYFILDEARNAIVGQVVLPNGARRINGVAMTVKIPFSAGPFVIGVFDPSGNFVPAGFLSVEKPADRPVRGGAVGR